jgi:hypothetical protein
MNRHRMYCWPSLSDEKYLLLGDSLVKFLNRAKHLRVVSVPGARTNAMIQKVCSGLIPTENFSLIIVAMGTNDVADVTMPPTLVAQGIVQLMARIEFINPTAVLMFSGLLVRPKDLGSQIELRRRVVNKLVFDMCNQRGYFCIKSWRCLMVKSQIRARVYATDGLHLNRTGARRLYNCLEGNILNLEGQINVYRRYLEVQK